MAMVLSQINLNEKRLKSYLAVALIGLIAFVVAFIAPIKSTGSDSRGSLLTAQSILQNHSVRIDFYGADVVDALTYRAYWRGNEAYYYYPLGPSLVALPFVAIANAFGFDMAKAEDDKVVQELLAAFSFSFSCVVFIIISNYYFQGIWVLLIGIILSFGSSMASTLATAYWNMDPLLIVQLLAILHVIRFDKEKIESLNPWYLGVLLTMAFLCRPTAAFFIIVVFLYVLLRDRKVFPFLALSSLVLLTVYFVFSVATYGAMLPPCYLQSVGSERSIWEGIYGVLFSPSRGVFVYSPFLIASMLGLIYYIRFAYRDLLVCLSLGWVCLHVLLIASWGMWWGGWSYGPRLLTDCFVGFAYLSIIVYSKGLHASSLYSVRLWKWMLLLLGAISVFINTYQGLYGRYANKWHSYPNPDVYTDILFDWSFPAFLGNRWQDEARNEYVFETYLKSNEVGVITALNGEVEVDLLYGWSSIEGDLESPFVWSDGKKSVIRLRAEVLDNPLSEVSEIQLKMKAFRSQSGWFQIGDSRIRFDVEKEMPVQDFILPVPDLKADADSVEIHILFDDPKRPADYSNSPDVRQLGFSLMSISVSYR